MLGLKKRNDLVKYIKNIPTHIGLLFHPSAEIQRYNRAASLTIGVQHYVHAVMVC